MHTREIIYDAGLRAALPLARALAPLHTRGAAAFQGRRDSELRLSEWSRMQRNASLPLVLVHAPSVGEALMAQAIIAQLRTMSNAQIVFTFFSPSAERVAARVGADVHAYLPFDTRPAMQKLVRDLAPSVIAFVRTEIWPVLGIEAQGAGARVALVNAALGASSSRLRGGARFLLGPAYRRLDAIGAIASDDAARFDMLGVDRSHVFVTGDARFDQVWNRVQSIDRNSAVLKLMRSERRLIVAGSTWPADEALLLDAYVGLGGDAPRARLVVAPHEPTADHIGSLEGRLSRAGIRHERLSAAEAAGICESDVIIVDRVGVLADLYAAADLAYVGGGFGDAGLHSVIEPAALAVPVLYGPRHGNAREAGDLASEGGGFVVRSAAEGGALLQRLLTDATARALAGTAAETFVRARLGGAAANAALLNGLITDRS